MKKKEEPYSEHLKPIQFAIQVGQRYALEGSQSNKKQKGQFFTPEVIAAFMAAQLSYPDKNHIRILDPGCGTAVLSLALLERILSSASVPEIIEIELYENDSDIITYLQEIIKYTKNYYSNLKVDLLFITHIADFVICHSDILSANPQLWTSRTSDKYDYIISNPPYFKLPKEDKRSQVANQSISGQQNIYSVFMAISAKLLQTTGEMIFITPRSFAAGKYFESFRNLLLQEVNITFAHLFTSRRDTFGHDNVLQETIIVKGEKSIRGKLNHEMVVSSSQGLRDLNKPEQMTFPLNNLIDLSSKEKIFHIPTHTCPKWIHMNPPKVRLQPLRAVFKPHFSDFRFV